MEKLCSDAGQNKESVGEEPAVEIETRAGRSFANFSCPVCARRMSIELRLLIRTKSISCLCGSARFEMNGTSEPVARRRA